MNKNILIFTGNGKGKSTSSFGMALRAAGHNQRIIIIQFMKKNSDIGELVSLKKLGIDIIQTGLGFVPKKENPRYADHVNAAQLGLKVAQQALNSGEYDLVILDEICGAIAKELLAEKDVIAAIKQASEPINIVLTGRYASARLIDIADTVSEINPIKHAFDQGIPAREGVEF